MEDLIGVLVGAALVMMGYLVGIYYGWLNRKYFRKNA